MGGRYLLALDAGGGGARALLLDGETGAATLSFRPWKHPRPDPADRWAYAFDWREAWRLFGEATRDVLARSRAQPGAIAAIAATGMRHGTVVIRRDGTETWAGPNRDARAAGQATGLGSIRGADLYRRTGHWPAPMLPLARLQWLVENEPQVLADARAILSVSDWLTWRLSGECVAELSQAGATGLLDLEAQAWATDLVTGIDTAQLPPLVAAGTRVGTLSATAADDLGLVAGIPVVVGAADTQAALAAGASDASAGVVAGTTMPILAAVDRPIVDGAARLWTGRHAIAGRWVLESNAGMAGEALDLLAKVLFPGERLGVARLLAEAASAPPGAGGILADLGVTLFNASGLGLPVGGLALSTLAASEAEAPRTNLARAVAEGLAFGVRANLAQVEEVSGRRSPGIALAGGLSRSDAWCQVLADALGQPVVRTALPEASLLGAGLFAAVGAGLFADLDEARATLAKPGRRFDPAATLRDTYDELYADWTAYRAARRDADEYAAGVVLRQETASEPGARLPVAAPGRRPRVLATAPLDEGSRARLTALADLRYEPFMDSQVVLTEDDLVEALDGIDVLVTEVDVVDAASLERLPALRAIFTCRADPVNVDVAAATAHGIPVMNAPGRNARSVAELTLAFALALARKPVAADRFLHDPATAAGDIARMGMAHATFEGRELRGLTIGLVGFGHVGREVASVLRPLGPRLVAADPFAKPLAALAEGVELVPLETLLAEADIVSLHAPVTGATRGMFGREQFAAMRASASFINTARAALVDEEALHEALAAGHLAGAALDVFAVEPPGHDHPLLALPNVIATPHIAGNTVDVARRQGEMVCEALAALLRGAAPATILNAETLPEFRWEGPRRAPSPAELAALGNGRGPAVTDLEAAAAAPAPAKAVPAAQPAPARPQPVTVAPAIREAPASSGNGSRFGKLLRGIRSAPPRQGGSPPPATPEVLPPSPSPNGASRAYWEQLFAEFVQALPSDAAVRKFAAGKNVIVRYHVEDLELVFHTGFTGDPPVTGMGEPPDAAHLTLRMTSAVLDDVFMERISGMKAAMSGKMAFSGNTMRAMALQRVQKDLNRVYRGVRERLGEPPDEPSAISHQPSASRQLIVADGRRPMADGDPERDEMVSRIGELFAARLLTSTGGNVSVRRAEHPDEAWITPSALPKGHLDAGMMVRIGMDGEPLDAGSLAPSSERLLHTAIYRARPEIGAIVHSHGANIFAFGLAGLPFLPVSTESAFFGDLPRVPFIMPGTEELAAATAEAMRTCNGALLVNHGSVVIAASLRRAVDMTAVMETTAGALMACHAAGIEPPVLPAEVVAELREVGQMIA